MAALVCRNAGGATVVPRPRPRPRPAAKVPGGGGVGGRRESDSRAAADADAEAHKSPPQHPRASITMSKLGRHYLAMCPVGDQHVVGIVLSILGLMATLAVLGIGIGEASEALESIQINWMFFLLGWGAAWGCYESLKEPRRESWATWFELICILLAFVGDILLVPYYFLSNGEVPELRYVNTATNERLIRMCPSLKSFKQTCWLQNPFFSFWVMVVRERFWRDRYQREYLIAQDGGRIALDWYTHDDGLRPNLSDETPILLLISTLVGGPMSYPNGKTLHQFAETGRYRSVCYVKRGCGIQRPNPYVTSKFWCLSDYEDLTMAVDHIHERYPHAPIVAVGVSTGGGQLRNYLARTGKFSKIRAGIVVDAGYNWNACVESMDKRLPIMSHAMAQFIGNSMVEFSQLHPKEAARFDLTPKKLRSISTMHDMILHCMAPTNGFPGKPLEYMHYSHPADPGPLDRPLLQFFTMNDMIICQDDIRSGENYPIANPNIINVTTKRGTHVIRWEGFTASKCWISQVALEFCDAILGETPNGKTDSFPVARIEEEVKRQQKMGVTECHGYGSSEDDSDKENRSTKTVK
eukprot:CAMPEP_0114488286 /NCGR_PEP_ID=MMETSP0109-20121206/1242_1 /TAXON_ID=29199 /ORGANISM="Chlorarachnion reptans, Strain CCCM449" /LENGTH=580 /DNA_ID=CAMNT_0001664655 /DNA_START=27 /DNA_END=1769 /DNA_ORIENTATION=+